jgi:hypothetical protein
MIARNGELLLRLTRYQASSTPPIIVFLFVEEMCEGSDEWMNGWANECTSYRPWDPTYKIVPRFPKLLQLGHQHLHNNNTIDKTQTMSE